MLILFVDVGFVIVDGVLLLLLLSASSLSRLGCWLRAWVGMGGGMVGEVFW